MSSRASYALVLAFCLAAILAARKAIDADHARQRTDGRRETTVDPRPPDPVIQPVAEGTPSPSAFASFKIDGMV